MFCDLFGSREKQVLRAIISFGFFSTLSLNLSADGFVFDPSSPLGQLLAGAPENGWVKLNTNRYQDVWTPEGQIPDPPPEGTVKGDPRTIIQAWSSMAWDSRRGDLIFFGGGHANYTGNDVYRWRASTLAWERASLPSAVQYTPLADDPWGGIFASVGGVDDAPISAHTYDNSEYFPVVDRYVTFGGAAYGSGPFRKPDGQGGTVVTGPYFWDPAKGDPNKVGGATGTQVNPGQFPTVEGGSMWQNRDSVTQVTDLGFAGSFLEGASAYATENGKDVLYLQAGRKLFRYTVNDLDNPAADTYEQVGRVTGAVGGQGAGAYAEDLNIFLRSFGGTDNFTFWRLGNAGPANDGIIFQPTVTGDTAFPLGNLGNYGLDYDPVRRQFVLWGGDDDVWALKPLDPGDLDGEWTLSLLVDETSADPAPSLEAAFPGTTQYFRGVLGKWKYSAALDAFLGVVDPMSGDVWAYKPANWRPKSTPFSSQQCTEILNSRKFESIAGLTDRYTIRAICGNMPEYTVDTRIAYLPEVTVGSTRFAGWLYPAGESGRWKAAGIHKTNHNGVLPAKYSNQTLTIPFISVYDKQNNLVGFFRAILNQGSDGLFSLRTSQLLSD